MLQEWGELVALVVALTQAIKRIYLAATGNELGDISIIVAVVLSIALSIARAIQMSAFTSPAEIIDAILAGIALGLTAAGLYSTVKSWAAAR